MKCINKSEAESRAQKYVKRYIPKLLETINKINKKGQIPFIKTATVNFKDPKNTGKASLLLHDLDEKFIKDILSADFARQKEIMDIFRKKYNFDVDDTSGKNDVYVKNTLEFIFIKHGYEDKEVFGKNDKMDFVNDTHLRVCPYCGRHYIFSLKKRTDDYLRPEIDHFLPRSKYPMFAMSFFNLIPSCRECNGLQSKGENDPYTRRTDTLKIMHPYEYKNEDLTFQFYSESPDITDFWSYKIQLLTKYEGYDEFLSLGKLYLQHNVELSDMIKTYQKLNETYREFLKDFNIASKYVESIFEEIYHLKDSENNEDRLLSKFYKDIWEELKTFNI